MYAVMTHARSSPENATSAAACNASRSRRGQIRHCSGRW